MESVTATKPAQPAQKNVEKRTERTVSKELQEKFIVLVIEDENFVISLEHVSEIVIVSEITQSPHQPSWVRGIMNLRDSVISLVDTRKRLGVKSTLDTHIKELSDAKTAHLAWIEQLDNSIMTGEPFKLSLDPHTCNYGKWMDAVIADPRTKADIKRRLKDTIEPHSAIHNNGKRAVDFLTAGKKTEATEILKELKEVYFPRMQHLLEDIMKATKKERSKEIAVILEYNGTNFAMLADSIQKMKTFTKERRQKGSLTDSPFVIGVYDDEDGLYQELDLKGILSGAEVELTELAANSAGNALGKK